LINYLLDGNCAISNNLIENSIRQFTVGRRNWLFSGSPRGAAASAIVYSIVETAKVNGLNLYKYLKFVFIELPGVQFGQHPEFLEDYLPWNNEVQQLCEYSIPKVQSFRSFSAPLFGNLVHSSRKFSAVLPEAMQS
jgi:transposase